MSTQLKLLSRSFTLGIKTLTQHPHPKHLRPSLGTQRHLLIASCNLSSLPGMTAPAEQQKEDKLLAHVLGHATKGDPESVLQTIDDFCWNVHWHMNIGAILDAAVASAQPIKLALELGTYCGYSAVRIARLLPPGAKFISVDPSDIPPRVAAAILEHAGLRDRVELVRGTAAEALPALAQRGLNFDFCLIDHAKELYLSDLQLLEREGLLRQGTVVAADNVVVFQLDDYMKHVRESGKYLSTQLHEAHVEYNKEKKDSVAVSLFGG